MREAVRSLNRRAGRSGPWLGLAAILFAATTSASVAQTAPAPKGAPDKLTVMMGIAQGTPSVAIYWTGKEAGFYAEENIEADVLTVPNGNLAQGVQLVMSGQADAVLTSIESVVVPAASGKDTGLVFVYNFFQRPNWRMLVRDDGSIKSASELKGKTVGILAPGNPSEPLLHTFLAEAGLSPNDVKVQAVGLELPAAQALKNGQIDALLTVTLVAAVWETVGLHFNTLPAPAQFNQLIGPSVAVPRASLRDPAKRSAIVRFLRNWAKSAVFVQANPEAAIRFNYKMFPQAKPRGASDAEAIKTGVQIQGDVLADYTIKVNGKWGAFKPDAFRNYMKFLGLQDKVADVDALWTNELIDEVNAFDEQAVAAKAKALK